jgi:hypothetical protein
VPGGAGLLPADVSPFSGDIIFYSLVAYPMKAGRIRSAPGRQAEKDGRRTKLKNVVTIWLSLRYWSSCSSIVFLVDNAENDRAKNWKDHIFSGLT